MTKIVSVSGKGGVGKTSLTALIIDELARAGFPGPVLAVDGDPATTLNMALGLPDPPATVADVRDTIRLNGRALRNAPAGMTREAMVHRQLEQAGVLQNYRLRTMRVSLMAMGRGEGQGCYCSVHNTLAKTLEGIMGYYPLVVMDNEAGLEHLSRYRVKHVDWFIVVAGADRVSQVVARRVMAVAEEVELSIKEGRLVLNRASGASDKKREDSAGNKTLKLPVEPLLLGGSEAAVEVPDDAPIRRDLQPLVQKILTEARNVR